MNVLRDYRGMAIRLTEERRTHILEHPEMQEMEPAMEQTLAAPENIVRSVSDEQVRLYYKMHSVRLWA